MVSTWVVDSGDTPRKLKDPWVVDGGGTPRQLKKIWVIDSGGTARLVFRSADVLSMICGTSANAVGYALGGFGALTPPDLGDGSVVQEITVADHLSPTPNVFIFEITGFPGTITVNYLASITLNGIVHTPQDANFTSFTGGGAGSIAQWQWGSVGFLTNGATVPVIVVRK